MSHHFDTPTAREDPRINICDFYLFAGAPGTTVMAMTVNPDAGLSAPESFREEAIYTFRFDLERRRSRGSRIQSDFWRGVHAGPVRAHVQTLEVRRAVGEEAIKGADGAIIAAGRTGEIVTTSTGTSVFAGLAPDVFAGDAKALGDFRTALFKNKQFDAPRVSQPSKLFRATQCIGHRAGGSDGTIGQGRVQAWATCSLHGHAPEVQVSRWGVPLLTNIFMPDQDMRETYNRAVPTEDLALIGGQIAAVTEELTTLAASAAEPRSYAERLAKFLCPSIMAYELGTAAGYDFIGVNGRALADDVMDVVLTWAANMALSDGVAPDRSRIRSEFPYFGEPYRPDEQAGVAAAHAPTKT